MPTEWCQDELDLGRSCGRRLVGAFDGGAITSNGGVVLRSAADRAIGLSRRLRQEAEALIASSRRDPEPISFAPVQVDAPAPGLPVSLPAAGPYDGSIEITIGTATVRTRSQDQDPVVPMRITLPDDESLLRVRELRCLHDLPSSPQPRELGGKL